MKTTSNTIVVIPARGGSKRLKHKNLKVFGGYSLLAHSILYAQRHIKDIPIIVSTEDERIKEEALRFGVAVVDRPSELASDTSTTIAVLQHVLDSVSPEVKDVILLQPTNPLRPKKLLSNALDFYKSQELDALFTVSPQIKKLGSIKGHRFVPENYKPGQRSQDIKPKYYENGLLYIVNKLHIRSGNIMPVGAKPYVVNHVFGTIDIDTEEDFELAEFFYKRYVTELDHLK